MNMKSKFYRRNGVTSYQFESGNSSFKVIIDVNNELRWSFKNKFPCTLDAMKYVVANESTYRHIIFVFIPFNAIYIQNIMKKSGFHEVQGHYGSTAQLWQVDLI